MHFHNIDANTCWVESDTKTLVTYDLRLEEHGWTCTCPSFVFRGGSCKHTAALVNRLHGPAHKAVKRALEGGRSLESMFDYSSEHKVTDRKRVVVRLDRLPIVCGKCGHENSPKAQICAVCANMPIEDALDEPALEDFEACAMMVEVA